jgi:hypothetical protein
MPLIILSSEKQVLIQYEERLPIMSNITTQLAKLEFETTIDVAGLSSIAPLFLSNERCGIYVLHFANGEHYAALAVNVARRYGQHRKTHLDIDRLSFKQVAPHKLRTVEKTIITSLEKGGFHLRNIEGTSRTYAPSPFDDEIMTPDDQVLWERDTLWQDVSGERVEDAKLRQQYRRRFSRFTALPHVETATSVLRDYVWACIPAPLLTEKYYWSCSLPLERRPDDLLVYLRVNINGHEVFTISTQHGDVHFGWHVSKSALGRVPLWMYTENHVYEAGDSDQIYIGASGLKGARRILTHSRAIAAMRTFNLRLMRKGPTRFYRYHVFDLADRLLK